MSGQDSTGYVAVARLAAELRLVDWGWGQGDLVGARSGLKYSLHGSVSQKIKFAKYLMIQYLAILIQMTRLG